MKPIHYFMFFTYLSLGTCRDKLKVLVDVDTGVDDAQALMMVLASEDVEVAAITCVAGNTGLNNVLQNTLVVLQAMDKLEIPVYGGCSKALVYEQVVDSSFLMGSNGLGGYEAENPPSLDLVKQQHAAQAIVDIVNAHPGEITLVALAPLTNIAVALELDPSVGSKLKDAVILGGNILAQGPYGLASEFNFGSDPEAANVALSRLGCPTTLIPFETCLQDVKFPWEWYEQLISVDTPRGRFHKALDEFPTQTRHKNNETEYYSFDPAAMAIAMDSSVVTSSKEVYGTIELRGEHSRGCLITDEQGQLGKTPNIKIAQALNTDKIKTLFTNMVQ